MATETAQPPTQPAARPSRPEIVRDRLYIGGEWVEPAGSDTIEVIDSTTEQVIGRIPEGTTEDVDRAVKAAREGFEAWREVPVEQRVEACTAISAALAERADEIAALIAAELGMPIVQSRMIQAGLPTMTFNSMPQMLGEVAFEEQVGNSLIVREPIGVVGCITPWNFPLHQVRGKGCACPCRRLHRRLQAERKCAADRVHPGRGIAGMVGLPKRPQLGLRLPAARRRSDRRPSGRGHGLVHRFPAGRAPLHCSRAIHEERGARTWRQVRLCDPRRRGPRTAISGARTAQQLGPDLQRATRMLVPRERLEEAEAVAQAAAEQPTPGDPFGTLSSARSCPVQRDRVRGYIEKGEGRRPARDRGAGRLKVSTRAITCGRRSSPTSNRHDDRAGGNLRPGAVDHSLRPRTRRSGSPTDRYGLAGGVWSATRSARSRSPAGCAPGRSTSTVAVQRAGAVRRLQAVGQRSGIGRYGLEEFLEVKAIQL